MYIEKINEVLEESLELLCSGKYSYIDSELNKISKDGIVTMVLMDNDGAKTRHLSLNRESYGLLLAFLNGKKQSGGYSYYASEFSKLNRRASINIKLRDEDGNQTKWLTLDKSLVKKLSLFK